MFDGRRLTSTTEPATECEAVLSTDEGQLKGSGGSSPASTELRPYGSGKPHGGEGHGRVGQHCLPHVSSPQKYARKRRDSGQSEQLQVALSRQMKVRHTPGAGTGHPVERETVQRATPSNKGLKLTSVEHIGRSQLNPSVGQTLRSTRATGRIRH